MADVDVTVIGGGIVGCAIAARVAVAGLSVVLLERADDVARGTTARNSEVAHGGMYYPMGSAKARHCVQGRRLLKAFCAEAGVAYRECGKLIVAVTGAEIPRLEELLALGEANGVEDLALLDGPGLHRLEPEVRAVAALHSPRTAVLDAEGAARAYAARARAAGAQVMTSAEVTGLARETGGWRVTVAARGEARREGWAHTSGRVVNAAGLWADRVAEMAGVDVDRRGWRLRWVKGNYFTIDPRHAGRVTRLVYPVPPADGSSLGIHLCVGLDGRLRLGPDTEAVDVRHEDYRVDPGRSGAFYREGVRYLPFLERADLAPDTSGLRPRLVRADSGGFRDFVVGRETGDLAGLIDLVGIESPGLTAAPSLADTVTGWLTEDGGA